MIIPINTPSLPPLPSPVSLYVDGSVCPSTNIAINITAPEPSSDPDVRKGIREIRVNIK